MVTSSWLLFVAWLLVAPPLISLGWFALETACGLARLRAPPTRSETAAVPTVIIVPAHDEAAGIGATVALLSAAAPSGCQILVVADNCADQTAVIARRAGAQVIERNQPHLRGKGYALACARDHLAQAPPAVVMIVDADCRISAASLRALVAAVAADGRPAQAVDVIEPDLGISAIAQISSFAMLVKNHVRMRGLQRLGGVSLLCGTGMAFAWDDLATAPLASGNVVEDLGLTIVMIRNGRRPRLVETAEVTSRAAEGLAGAAQRSRWEQGFLAMAWECALPLLGRGLIAGRRGEIALGMHLLVPPLALLALVAATALALSAGLAAATGLWLPTKTLAAGLVAAAALVSIAWWRQGRATLALKALPRIASYVFWKAPIYVRTLSGRRAVWVRTRRDGDR